MGKIRRISACLMALLVLQLTVLGAASPCTHGPDTGARATEPSPDQYGSTDCHESEESRQSAPAAPENCVAMTSCSMALLELPAPALEEGVMAAAHPAALRALQPPTRSTAPELPPPRV